MPPGRLQLLVSGGGIIRICRPRMIGPAGQHVALRRAGRSREVRPDPTVDLLLVAAGAFMIVQTPFEGGVGRSAIHGAGRQRHHAEIVPPGRTGVAVVFQFF